MVMTKPMRGSQVEVILQEDRHVGVVHRPDHGHPEETEAQQEGPAAESRSSLMPHLLLAKKTSGAGYAADAANSRPRDLRRTEACPSSPPQTSAGSGRHGAYLFFAIFLAVFFTASSPSSRLLTGFFTVFSTPS